LRLTFGCIEERTENSEKLIGIELDARLAPVKFSSASQLSVCFVIVGGVLGWLAGKGHELKESALTELSSVPVSILGAPNQRWLDRWEKE
jgi:hypothetical protein